MELMLHFPIQENNNLNNNINSSKYKRIILFNTFIIISNLIFIYQYYNSFSQKENQISLFDEQQNLYKSKEEKYNINKEIKISKLKQYNNKYFEISREKFLYEKQKELIFASLTNNIFIGEWNSSINNSEINWGESSIHFYKAREKWSRQISLSMEIKNNEGKYMDSWLKIISYAKYQDLIKKINLKNKIFEISGQFKMKLEKYEIFNTKYKKNNCISNINIIFPLLYASINVTTLSGNNAYLGLLPIVNNKNFTLKFVSNCSIDFNLNVKKISKEKEKEIKQGKLKVYFFLGLFSTILYGIGIIFLYCGIRNNEGYLTCINIEIFSLNSVWNNYCCVNNICIAFNTDFNFFLIFCCMGLLSLLKFFALDMIILSAYWKIKERRIINSCRLIKLKLRFYLFLILCLICSLFFLYNFLFNYYCMILISLLLWFPQIIYNIISNNKYGYPFIFILTCSIDRLIYPFYFRAYENNYFHLRTNLYIFIFSIVIIAFCVIILLIQTFNGPRFMLPEKYQENQCEFYKDFDEIQNICKDINEECVICLMPIYPEKKEEMVEMKENNKNKNDRDDKDKNKETDDESTKEQIIDSMILDSSDENSINDSNRLLIKEENNFKEENKNIIIQPNKKFICKSFFMKIGIFLKEFFKKNFFYFYKSESNFNKKPFILTPCKHIFHSFCLDKWLEQKKECPNCRKSLDNYF